MKPWKPAERLPAFSSRVTEMEKGIVGIDVGGTNFRIGTVMQDGRVLDFQKVPVKAVFTSEDPLADLSACLNAYCAGKKVEAICIGFPATLDAKRRTVLQAPNVPYMENLPVVSVLTDALGIPVFIERDVTMALIYDCSRYEIPEEGIVCGFYFGTGIGNAISIDGVPIVGKNGTAGELGHIPVDGSDVVCGCGNVGCMEPLAGGRYLQHLCETVCTDTPIDRLFLEHAGEPYLQKFVDRMAMAVATEINILNPHRILIGGGVPAMAGFPKKLLLERIRFHARKPYPADDLSVIFTGDTEEKCCLLFCGDHQFYPVHPF